MSLTTLRLPKSDPLGLEDRHAGEAVAKRLATLPDQMSMIWRSDSVPPAQELGPRA